MSRYSFMKSFAFPLVGVVWLSGCTMLKDRPLFSLSPAKFIVQPRGSYTPAGTEIP